MSASERLRELERAATPGSWHASPSHDAVACDADLTEFVAYVHRKITDNADLIAAVRNALPALLDVAETARAQPEYNKKQLRDALAALDKLP